MLLIGTEERPQVIAFIPSNGREGLEVTTALARAPTGAIDTATLEAVPMLKDVSDPGPVIIDQTPDPQPKLTSPTPPATAPAQQSAAVVILPKSKRNRTPKPTPPETPPALTAPPPTPDELIDALIEAAGG